MKARDDANNIARKHAFPRRDSGGHGLETRGDSVAMIDADDPSVDNGSGEEHRA